jgi:antitoxin MazE
MLVKTLTKVGNSLALFLDKGILELFNIDEKTPLKISTDGKKFIITPLTASEKAKLVSESPDKISKRHQKVLKKTSK